MIKLNKIYNESCLETMQRMDDLYIDLTVTSPPYNMRLRIRNGEYTTREKSEHFSKKYDHFDDALPIDKYYQFHKQVIGELLRVSKTIIYNVAIVTGSKEAVFKLIGHYAKSIKDVIVWDKGNGEPAMHENVINRATELILVMENGANAGRALNRANFDRGTLNDIWRAKRPRSRNGHRAIMPDKIAGLAITSFSKEGDIVYDPFGGSGTTARMAHTYKRNWILSEISEEYSKMGQREIDFLMQQCVLF